MVYNLTAQDVLHTRLLLSTFDLPSEVIDIILDSAAYWALISCHRSEEVIVRADEPAPGVKSAQSEDVLSWYSEHQYLSLEIPANEGTRARMVKFRLRSSDQGRSNNAMCRGTYNSSSSWFSVAVESPPSTPKFDRASAALESPRKHPLRWFLQSNVHGARNRRTHEIVWTSTDDAIAPSQRDRELAPGGIDAKETEKEEQRSSPTGGPGDELGGRDEKTGSGTGFGFCQAVNPGSTIFLYACAQFSGWENHVWCAEAEVYCLV